MNGALYSYQRTHTAKCNDNGCRADCKIERLDEAIRVAIKAFEKKYKYHPEFVIIRHDEHVNGMKYNIRVVKVNSHCPPSHFFLCPLVVRQARVLKLDRVAYT